MEVVVLPRRANSFCLAQLKDRTRGRRRLDLQQDLAAKATSRIRFPSEGLVDVEL